MTRHELKEQLQHDHFTDAVSDVVSYARVNRELLTRLVFAAVVILLLGAAAIWFTSYKRSERQQALDAAMRVVEAPVGTSTSVPTSYPTQAAKQQAEIRSLSDVVTRYGGSREGLIAEYYLGTVKAQTNDSKGAESNLKRVADSSSDFAALAKIALAQLFAGENRISDARALLKSISDKPSDLVSTTQAQILLAQLDVSTNPQEAKKILQSLRGPKQAPAVTRAIDQVSGQLTH